jgi:hypothetical protein
MAAVVTATTVVHEDLSDELIQADVRNTPLSSRMRKGAKLTNMEFSWPLESLGPRQVTPPAENADVTTYEGDTEVRTYNRAQRFWRQPRVSVISDRVNDTAGDFGKYAHQVRKRVEDQKRDIEFVLLSLQQSAADTGSVGTKTMGLGIAINDGTIAWTDALTTPPAGYRTPAAQIYTGLLSALDEATFVNILKARFDALGMTTELTLFAGSALKAHISEFFGKYKPDKTNYTVVVRTQTEAQDSRKFAGYGVDMYEGDFGAFDIVVDPWMPDQLSGYGLNMELIQMRPSYYCDVTKLPYMGGGESALVDSILGYEYGDARTHFKIAPSGA